MIENAIANQDWVRNLTFLPDEIETLLYKVLIGPFFITWNINPIITTKRKSGERTWFSILVRKFLNLS